MEYLIGVFTSNVNDMIICSIRTMLLLPINVVMFHYLLQIFNTISYPYSPSNIHIGFVIFKGTSSIFLLVTCEPSIKYENCCSWDWCCWRIYHEQTQSRRGQYSKGL